MSTSRLCLAIPLLFCASAAMAQTLDGPVVKTPDGVELPPGANLSPGDQMFLKKVAVESEFEVHANRIAAQKASDSTVREVAGRGLQEQTRTREEVIRLASAKDVVLPASLSARDRSALQVLDRHDGRAFDKVYRRQMQMEQRQLLALFSLEAEQGHDLDVKAWAASVLPTLQQRVAATGSRANRHA